MKKNVCIACGSTVRPLGKVEDREIFICGKCGLGMTIGVGKKEQYHEYHRDSAYVKATDQFKNIFNKRVEIISRFKTSGRVLEVGASTGLFLSLMKDRGWEVLGVEPSGTSSSEARKRDIPMLNTTFELANLKAGSFDVVILNHVLEHMTNPLEALKKARKLLRRDGIVFVDVPNFSSFTARVQKTGWKYLLPKEHLWHFTPASLFLILEKAGFNVAYWEAHSGIWGYGSPYLELWQTLHGLKKRFLWNVVSIIPSWALTKFKAGTGLSVVAQKV